MKAAIVLLLFIGMFMVISGIYEEKYNRLRQMIRTEYKFIPRTLYEDSIASADLRQFYSANFFSDDPWHDRTVFNKI